MINTEYFVVIAGNPTKWDQEMRDRSTTTDFREIQREQHERGRRSALLDHSGIFGWIVQAHSSLDDRAVLGPPRTGRSLAEQGFVAGTKAKAIEWGIAWAEADPDNREFIARKPDTPSEYINGCAQVQARRAAGQQA